MVWRNTKEILDRENRRRSGEVGIGEVIGEIIIWWRNIIFSPGPTISKGMVLMDRSHGFYELFLEQFIRCLVNDGKSNFRMIQIVGVRMKGAR